MEGKSSGDETLADLQAKWEATHGGGNSPTDPDAPPVDTGSCSTSSWSGTTDGSQPAGGWFSGGGYAADGFKQIDSRTSDGTTIQSWVSPDGMTTVTETHTSDGTTSTVVRDEYGNEIYSSITDSDGNTTTTTDGVDQTVTSTNVPAQWPRRAIRRTEYSSAPSNSRSVAPDFCAPKLCHQYRATCHRVGRSIMHLA